MFERFSTAARDVVVNAQQEARALGHDRIGTEHVLLGLLSGAGDPAAEALAAHGVDLATMRALVGRIGAGGGGDLDADALAAIGIDLDQVRAATEASFGPGALDAPQQGRKKGHIPFRPAAKKALELSLRHALRLKHNHIGTGHILLGLVHDGDNTACLLLRQAGVNLDDLRADVTRRTSAEAA